MVVIVPLAVGVGGEIAGAVRGGEGVAVETVSLTALAASIDEIDLSVAARADVAARLSLVTRLARVAEAEEVACVGRLVHLAGHDPSLVVEQIVARATNRSVAAASRVVERAEALDRWPALLAALRAGAISAGHVDVAVRARRSLPKALRTRFDGAESSLADAAAALPLDEFRDRAAALVRDIEADDGAARLQRQRRRTRARTWTDRDGMWNLHGRFDPERALVLSELVRRQTEHVFRTGDHPTEGIPDDPVERHLWFQAIAVEQLLTGRGAVGGDAPEFVITIDERTLLEGRHHDSRVDASGRDDLPIDTLRRCAARARFVPVVLDQHGVAIGVGRPVHSLAAVRDSLHRPVQLDFGRTRRHATRNQRRALRAMYRHCAIPGCRVPVGRCEPHHVDHWELGGHTDLARLLPLCAHHHDRLHAEDWQLDLTADRSLTIRRDGQVIMTTGPPRHQWA